MGTVTIGWRACRVDGIQGGGRRKGKGRLLTGREKYEGREGSLGRRNNAGKGVGWGRVDPLGVLAQLGIGPRGGK